MSMLASLESPVDLLLLLLVALLIFGAKRLPEIGRSLGSGLRQFREGISGDGVLRETVEELHELKTAVSPSNAVRQLLASDAAQTTSEAPPNDSTLDPPAAT